MSIKTQKVLHYWSFSIVLTYSLLMAEYLNTVGREVSFAANNMIPDTSILKYIYLSNYVITIISGIVVWIISSFLFHIFSILLGGQGEFKDFIKYSGLLYVFPLIGFTICLVLFESVQLPDTNLDYFFSTNSLVIAITWIINASSSLCFLLLIPIIKYFYEFNWLKAIGSVLIPIGSIYLLSQFFANYVL